MERLALRGLLPALPDDGSRLPHAIAQAVADAYGNQWFWRPAMASGT
jgi:hypothetical protein